MNSDEFKTGDRVMVYDVALKGGQAVGYVYNSKYTRHPYEIAVRFKKKGLYWVHKKQVRKLKSKPNEQT